MHVVIDVLALLGDVPNQHPEDFGGGKRAGGLEIQVAELIAHLIFHVDRMREEKVVVSHVKGFSYNYDFFPGEH